MTKPIEFYDRPLRTEPLFAENKVYVKKTKIVSCKLQGNVTLLPHVQDA
jgi:hypothetical protein